MTEITRESLGKAMVAASEWLTANPDKHIRLSLARTKRGHEIAPYYDAADCFCALGRTCFELRSTSFHVVGLMTDAFEGNLPLTIAKLNDGPDKEEALALMRSKGKELLA